MQRCTTAATQLSECEGLSGRTMSRLTTVLLRPSAAWSSPPQEEASGARRLRPLHDSLRRRRGRLHRGVTDAASVFLSVPQENWVASNEYVFAILDANPVSAGHTLIVPRRVVRSWFDTTHREREAALDLLGVVKRSLEERFHPDGYNVGFNDGVAAGQTVFHAHLHVIPRHSGDVPDPRGGVRHAVVGRGHYDVR